MKPGLKLLILLILVTNSFGQNYGKLYPVRHGELWGYIDKTGKLVISYQYHSAERFSEGLAAVRPNGTYGFIDTSGKFVITPQYDYAEPFDYGLAEVYLNGIPYFIDHDGKIQFEHNFFEIQQFGFHNYTVANTKNGNKCLINRKGEMLTDTVFIEIREFNDGVAVVKGLNDRYDETKKKHIDEVGVIDTTGKMITMYGKYKEIRDFLNGFSLTEPIDDSIKIKDVLYKNGKVRFSLACNQIEFEYKNINYCDSIVILNHFIVNPVMRCSSPRGRNIPTAFNTNGKILWTDTNYTKITPFSYNRAFAQNKDNEGQVNDIDGKLVQLYNNFWSLIDKSGKLVCSTHFDEVFYNYSNENYEPPFQEGKALVKLKGDWCLIDTIGNVISILNNLEIVNSDEIDNRKGNVLFLKLENDENDNFLLLYGFYDMAQNTMIKPVYNEIDKNSFLNDLISVIYNETLEYLNPDGKLIWAEDTLDKKIKFLNIDYKNLNGYYVSTKSYKDSLDSWDLITDQKKIHGNYFTGNKINIIVDTNYKEIYENEYFGYKVFIGNLTKNDLKFPCDANTLFMNVQAKDEVGQWRFIEIMPNSGCGNAFGILTLDSGYYWSFITPLYTGSFKTKLRIIFIYYDQNSDFKKGKRKIIEVYSNEYDGSVNPAQFWREKDFNE